MPKIKIAKPLLNISTLERMAAQEQYTRKGWLASLDPWLSNSIHNLLDHSKKINKKIMKCRSQYNHCRVNSGLP